LREGKQGSRGGINREDLIPGGADPNFLLYGATGVC